jgi:CheY-like chemotaxis protein
MKQYDDLKSLPADQKSILKAPAHRPIRIALVEDQEEVRENWTRRINALPEFHCVCSCNSAEEALTVIPLNNPEVVLMDIFLPRMSGIECVARLKAKLPDVQSSFSQRWIIRNFCSWRWRRARTAIC